MKEGYVREATEGLGTRQTLEPSYLGMAVAPLLTSSVTSSQSFDLSVPRFPHPQHGESVRTCLGECQDKMSSYELLLSRAPGISVHEHSEALP